MIIRAGWVWVGFLLGVGVACIVISVLAQQSGVCS